MSEKEYQLVSPEEVGLHRDSYEVTNDTAKWLVEEVFPHMVEILRANGGVGLTAIQIGVPYQASIIHAERGKPVFAFFNARYYPLEGRLQRYEGCLSYSDKEARKVKRHKKIRAMYEMWDGERLVKVSQKMQGYFARIYQHEVDHQHGRTIYT